MSRLDALAVRESKGKSYFTKIGAAFPTKTGGWSILLDAIPAPIDGQFKILLMEPRDNSAAKSPPAKDYQRYGRQADPFGDDLDDNVPF